jgi:hypothetical protein
MTRGVVTLKNQVLYQLWYESLAHTVGERNGTFAFVYAFRVKNPEDMCQAGIVADGEGWGFTSLANKRRLLRELRHILHEVEKCPIIEEVTE